MVEIIEAAIESFVAAEAQKLNLPVEKVSISIKVTPAPEGKPYYGLLIGGKWDEAAGSRTFEISEILAILG